MVDFHAAAVRYGKPGKLYATKYDTVTPVVEPTDATSAWGPEWVCLGYTAEGSTINYEISTENVEVAEELDPLARVTTGRDASVEVALAEITKNNLSVVFNGGLIAGDGLVWEIEPPILGAEERIVLGWDASPTPADNDLRFIFRKCLQGGSVSMSNRKGAEKATLTATFQLEKPDNGDPIFIIFGGAALNPVP